jgi:trimethylamine---corrinoid protein Co-methyltransferase
MLSTVLNNEQIKKIHNMSLRILEKVGIVIPHEEILGRFRDLGAQVDKSKNLVKIPPQLVERMLQKAGKQFTFYGRDRGKTAAFGQGKRNYNSAAGEALWIDHPGAERRYPSLSDVASATRVADALKYITIPGSMADPYELPVTWRCVAVVAEMIRNTTKPITFWYHDRASAKYINELVIALRGSKEEAQKFPLCYPFLEPISPLSFPFNGIDLLFETSKLGMPVSIGPMAQMGVSAPSTLAGTMAVENAEILAGVCVTQIIAEGIPVCYGGICHAFDMAVTNMIFSGPEQAIFGVAMTQMGKFYGLPVYINVGLTDSKRPDAQAGMESGITLSLGAAAGADIFGHMGISGMDQGASLDTLIMQHEIISYVESVMRSIDFSDEAFGFDVLAEVGPRGTLINQIHTVEHFRQELWFPNLLDRNAYESWLTSGASNMEERCIQSKEKILATHKTEPLDSHMEKEFQRIIKAAQEELK